MGRYSRFAVYGARVRMCSATSTCPSLRSALAFASSACTSAADANVFMIDASICAAGAWGSAVDADDLAAEDSAGFPAITATAAMSASTILIPRVRMQTSLFRDHYFYFPVGHTYTPEGRPGEHKLIFAGYLPTGNKAGNRKVIWNLPEMVYEVSVPAGHFKCYSCDSEGLPIRLRRIT